MVRVEYTKYDGTVYIARVDRKNLGKVDRYYKGFAKGYRILGEVR